MTFRFVRKKKLTDGHHQRIQSNQIFANMTEVKRGTLKFYHRGLLSKKWKYYHFILYDSSLLTWYADIKHKKPDGMVLLKDVEQYICVGPYTRYLPDFPQLENEYDQVALIAFPLTVKNRDRDIVWLQCEDVNDLNSWMKAMVKTLPSHTLRMERLPTLSSDSLDEQTPTIEQNDVTKINVPSVGLPLAAGLVATRLQGHAMNAKDHPLHRAGYDYGDTLWGTGEGWGYFQPDIVPGFAGLGGGVAACAIHHATEEAIEDDEEPTYELPKNDIEPEEQTEGVLIDHQDEQLVETEDVDEDEVEVENDEERDEIEDELRMIDSDGDK